MENFSIEILEFLNTGKLLLIINKFFFCVCVEKCIRMKCLTVAVFIYFRKLTVIFSGP